MNYKKIILPCAWIAEELKKHPDWIYNLSKDECAEINTAYLTNRSKKLANMTKEGFLMPSLANMIENKFLNQLENGISALLIRGFDVENYSISALEKIFYGIGLHFGTPVSQSVDGEKLHHVFDQGLAKDEKKRRGTNTSLPLIMHNDTCDVPGLMCVKKSLSGGKSKIVSSVTLHNEILKINPDLLSELYKPYYTLRHRVNTTLKQEHYARLIFSDTDGYFACNILRTFIDLAQQNDDIPKMSKSQIQALDLFEQLASSDKLCHSFQLEPGDMLFMNSYTTLHAREAFQDGREEHEKRLLLRLWLSLKNSRPLAESYRTAYRNIKAGEIRGGILPKKQ